MICQLLALRAGTFGSGTTVHGAAEFGTGVVMLSKFLLAKMPGIVAQEPSSR